MISDNSRQFLKLLLRSPDHGDGWRSVSAVVWPLVTSFKEQELLELDNDAKRVRLSSSGQTVVGYLI